MKRCLRCLVPDTRPDTFFNDEGVCSACVSYAKRDNIDWEARFRMLREIIDRHNGRVIVASSGGKDSTYQAITLKEMGCDVTAVTATTCWLSDVGRRNIDSLARHVRTIEVTPNMTVRRKLNRLGLEMVGDVSWAEHVSIHRVPFRAARDLRRTLIFYGECPLNQYGSPPGLEETRAMTQRYVSEFGGFLGLRTSDVVGMEGITVEDMLDYEAPTDAELAKSGIEAYFLGWFLPWDSRANYDVARRNGFQCELPCEANVWEFENVDGILTSIHDWFGWLKYGFGRATAQLSADIRSGVLSRDDAEQIMRTRDGLFPSTYLRVSIEAMLDELSITQDRFLECAQRYTNENLFADPRIRWRQSPRLKEQYGARLASHT